MENINRIRSYLGAIVIPTFAIPIHFRGIDLSPEDFMLPERQKLRQV
jgi:hypothetical protein